MNNTLQIASVFLAELGLGSAIILPFFPNKVTGQSWLRFYYGFIVATLAVFMVCLYRLDQLHTNYILIASLGAWIWIMSFVRQSFSKSEQALMWVFAFVSLALFFIYPQKFLFHGVGLSNYIVPFLLLLSGALFLSFSMMNMIFGHWYLVNRSLPIKHLIKTSKVLVYYSYFRLFTVGLATYWAYTTMDSASFDRLIDFMGHGIFFWARILAGLGVPLLVAHLSYESAKIHSNQSATGILYAGCVFVIMGELMALYLFSVTGIVF